MIAKKSEKLKRSSITSGLILALIGIVFIILAAVFNGQAEELKEAAKVGSLFGNTSYAIEYQLMNTMVVTFIICGIIMIIGAGLIVLLMLRVYYNTSITVNDESVTGIGLVSVFGRKNFSAPLQKVTNPVIVNNRVSFNIDGQIYTVYTDDANTVYRMLIEKK